jgi:hypothetical protein
MISQRNKTTLVDDVLITGQLFDSKKFKRNVRTRKVLSVKQIEKRAKSLQKAQIKFINRNKEVPDFEPIENMKKINMKKMLN